MSDHPAPLGSQKPLIGAIGALVALYVVALVMQWPPLGGHDSHGDVSQATQPADDPATASDADVPPADTSPDAESTGEPSAASQDSGESHGDSHAAQPPPFYTVVPFILLLGAIAVLPLVPKASHWWEFNRNRLLVAATLGGLTLLWYLTQRGAEAALHTIEHAMLDEYVPFIVLLFSLYTISGGIRIECDLRAHPMVNTAFIGIGGALASFIGTTGAAMLLIRPLLETNRERRHVAHTVVFFIFVVCNCGGCLLPIGDPPLFLGYLRGVEFFWTFNLWKEWLFVNAVLLAVYYAWDRFYAYRRESLEDIARDETQLRPLRIAGLGINGLLLVGVILSVAFLDPSKALPGTSWHPPKFLREIVQLALVGLSLSLGSLEIRRQNHFNYHAILEVAALFLGIFICMQPALAILNAHGSQLGIDTSHKFFWITGTLSSVLDNAPTYVVFFQTANAMSHDPGPGILQLLDGNFIREDLLIAISLGAVFMGAMTYIGNGPNFMVKAIAESSGIRMPSFFGYMLYSVVILVPIFLVMTLIFL